MMWKSSFRKNLSPSRAYALKIAVWYFVLGSAWIILSDLDILALLPGAANERITQWQTAKGLLFIAVTSVLLYTLSRRISRSIDVANDALTRSEERLRVAMDNIPSIFVIYDAQLRFLFLNHLAVQIGGRTRDEMLGRRDNELFSPESTSCYLPLLHLAQQTRAPQSEECKVLLPDGRTVYAIVTYVPLLDERGELFQIIGATHNITERKQGEEALRRSEEQFRRLADNLPGLVYVCLNDQHYTMLYMSSGSEQVLGYPAETFVNHELTFMELIHPDDKQNVIDDVNSAVAASSAYHLVYRLKHKSGKWNWLEEHGSGNYVDGKLESLQGYVRDITCERHEQKNQLVLAQLGHNLAAADTMRMLGEAIITATTELWAWDALALYLRQSGQERFRTIVEVDTFDEEKQFFWSRCDDADLSVGKSIREPLLINRPADSSGKPDNSFGDEARPSKSLMYAALLIERKNVGILSVQSYTTGLFNHEDLVMLQQIADAAAPAMERCKAEERNRIFSELGEKLSGTVTPFDAAEIIASVADDMIGWDSCSINLYFPETNRVEHLIAYDEVDGKRILLQGLPEISPAGLVKRALTEGQLLILRNPSDVVGPEVRPFGDTSRMSASLMWAPIRSSTGISGVFSIQSYTYQAYDDEDLQLFQALANHCSSTLERAQAQQFLRTQEQHYRQAISSAGAVPYQLDYINKRYAFVGDGIEAITGWSAEEFTTEAWNAMVLETVAHGANDETGYREIAQEIRDGRRTNWRADIRIRTRSGAKRWVADTSVSMTDENGRCIGCLGILQDITERKETERQLLHTSLHDSLTGLANRALLLDHIQLALHRAHRRESYHFAIFFLDIDRFKNINDSLGHLMGDTLLVTVGQRLEGSVRPGDTVARFAGDEFVVLLDDISQPHDAIPIAEKILAKISEPMQLEGKEVFVSASLGIAFDSPEYTEPEAVLRDADNALYRAKARGKACIEVFNTQMHQSALSNLELENDLRRALERNELRLHYQPIIDLISGQISGFEGLLRWQHPTRGLVSPIDFIPMAEETRLIIPIGQWVMEEAARQLRQWHEKFSFSCTTLSMAVNLSVRQFAIPNLDERMLNAVTELNMDPKCFNLEITESTLMEKHDTIINSLNRLREAGFGLSLDDFGTGYSSLSYLHQFPISMVKIDRSFVSRIEQAGPEREIVRLITQLAENLGMGVTAEGVETKEQLAILKEVGCKYVQGYFLSIPLPAAEATKLLAGNPHWEI